MDKCRADMWRTARMNQIMHRSLATRYGRLELWSSVILAVLGSGSVISVVQSDGDWKATAAAMTCAVLMAVRPLANWATIGAERHASWLAWRRVEELCQDGAPDVEVREAARQAHRLDPQSDPVGWESLRERAFAATNRELPASTFA